MNTGKLEVRYKDCILEITPDWFVISDVDDGVKYTCETKDAYERNILDFIKIDNNTFIDNPDCWVGFLTFEDEEVNDNLYCLVAAYSNSWIEEYLEEYGMELKYFNIDVKYTK